MQKKLILVLSALLWLGTGYASAQMTDEAIVSYIAQGISAGKSEAQVGSELISKGISASQIRRLMNLYQSGGMGSTIPGMAQASKLDESRSARETVMTESDSKLKPQTSEVQKEDSLDVVFGHDVFTGRTLTFEPNVNAATPEDYVLGPGDELIIDIWGLNEATIRQTVSPEGRILISQVGSIQVGGLTIKQATGKIKSALSKRYSGLIGSSSGSQVSVSLGNIRSIQVSIIGAVEVPGTYRLSSFTNVFNALYRAGGVTATGTLRDVKVMRGGEEVASVDIYSYLLDGALDTNISLKEGDVINVLPYSNLVRISGGVKRPMFYELKDGETLEDLVRYAGGWTADAYRDNMTVVRTDGVINSVASVDSKDYATYALKDGDMVAVTVSGDQLYANRLEVRGSVARPGVYELGSGIATVRQLVEHAGGLLEDAFTSRAQIIREKADRSMEIVPVAIGAVMNGTVEDVLLKKNDVLVIANVNEIEPKGDVTIAGYVSKPGKYEYAEHMTVEDLILLAGGMIDGASTSNVEVARRVNDPDAQTAPEQIAEVFTFQIKDGLILSGDGSFELMPYDVVSVRKSPSYVEQRNVSITGEVNFPGQYSLTSNNDRLSDLLKRAGGATSNAFVHGAMLKRTIDQYERNVRGGITRMTMQQDEDEAINADKLKVSEVYTVGVELDKALANPGSDFDMILRDGDELIIPSKTTTVRIQGEVLYPNTVHFISGRGVSYYVHQAGGFSNRAKRSKVYVLYMNGTAATGLGAKVEPGCEIIVPNKKDKERLSTTEIMSIGSSTASIAAVVLTIINTLKNSKN